MSEAESPRRVGEGPELSDPLLRSGCFIDPTEIGDPENPVPGTPNNLGDSTNGADMTPDSVPDGINKSNGTATVDSRGSASAEDSKSRRRIRLPTDSPDWLPKGWIVEDRVRTSGATAGSIDKYYFEPVSRLVFRSKNEVLHYVQTGTRLKRKKNVDSADSEAMDANGSGGRKQKNTAVPFTPPTLDFENVPTVTWVLKDRAKDSWVPHMDGREASVHPSTPSSSAVIASLQLQLLDAFRMGTEATNEGDCLCGKDSYYGHCCCSDKRNSNKRQFAACRQLRSFHNILWRATSHTLSVFLAVVGVDGCPLCACYLPSIALDLFPKPVKTDA